MDKQLQTLEKETAPHKSLDVYHVSLDFVQEVYLTTRLLPDDEKFGLVSQIRRAAVSIPTNIAEGAARQSPKEFIHFLHIALGSTVEVDTLLVICKRLNYINEEHYQVIADQIDRIGKMTSGLIRYQKKKLVTRDS